MSKLRDIYNKLNRVNVEPCGWKSNIDGLTMTEYAAACDCFNELSKEGKTETFMKSVAKWYRDNGATVTHGEVNYTITV